MNMGCPKLRIASARERMSPSRAPEFTRLVETFPQEIMGILPVETSQGSFQEGNGTDHGWK
jgi:hypothetical protein